MGISVPIGLLLFDWDWRLCARLPGCQPKRLVPFSRRLLWPCGVRANLWLWRGDRELTGRKKKGGGGAQRQICEGTKNRHTHTEKIKNIYLNKNLRNEFDVDICRQIQFNTHTHARTHTWGRPGCSSPIYLIWDQINYNKGMPGYRGHRLLWMICVLPNYTQTYTQWVTNMRTVIQTHTHMHAHVHTKTSPSHSYLTLCVLRWVYYDRLSGGEGIKLLSRHQRQSNV